MAIDPRSLGTLSTQQGMAEQMADLKRAIARLNATRTVIGAETITGTQIASGSIIAANIQAGTITAALIQAGTITAFQIAAHTITANEIAANTITANEIAANTITANQIAANTITANQIAADTITANEIAANAITATELNALAVTAGKIAANAVTAGTVAANAVTAGTIATGAVTAGTIAANAVTATEIAANSITASHIQSNAVTAIKISVSNLAAISTDMGSISAGTITGGTVQTAASGSRVVLNSTGIKGYASNGTTVNFDFNTGSGILTANGIIIAQTGSDLPAAVISGSLPGGGNMLTNSSFEHATPLTGWSLYNNGVSPAPSLTSSTTFKKYGTTAARLLNSTGTTGQMGVVHAQTNGIEPGKSYTLSAYGLAAVGAGTSKLRCNINWINSVGGVISSTTGALVTGVASTWVRASVTGVAPAGAVGVTSYTWVDTLVSGGDWYIDGVQLEESDVEGSYAPKVDEILPGTVGAAEIADLSVGTAEIATDAVTNVKIGPSAVDTLELAPLAVDNSKLAANSVTASKILAGTITATEIASNAITANKLLVVIGGGNLAPNSYFATPGTGQPTAWFPSSSTLAYVSSPTYFGTKAIQVTATGTGPSWIYCGTPVTAGNGIPPANAGTTYTISWWVQGAGTAHSAAAVLRWYDASNAQIGSDVTGTAANTVVGAWARFSVTATAPAGTVKVGALFRTAVNTIGDVYYAGAVQIEEGDVPTAYAPAANDIAPGTIVAAHLAANSVTAAAILAGTIGATQIAAGAITTEKLTVGSVTNSALLNGGAEDPSAADNTVPANTRRNISWAGNATTATRTSVAARSGSFGMKLDRDFTGALSGSFQFDSVPVNEGEVWTFSCWARGVSGTQNAYMRVMGGTTPNSVAVGVTPDATGMSNTNLSTTWTRYFGTVTIPAGMTWAAPVVLNHVGTTGSGTIYVDDVSFSKVVVSAQIADGAITAAKIVVTGLDASVITAGTITSTQINATSIRTAILTAGSVTANTIAAGAIQAQHLSVSSPSPVDIANGSFQDPVVAGVAPSWPKTGAGTVSNVVDANFGTVLQIAAPSDTFVTQAVDLPTGRHIFRAWIKVSAYTSGTLRWEASVNSGTVTAITLPTALAAVTNWTLQEMIIEVTSATANVTFRARAAGVSTAQYANAHLLASVTTTEISPGAITTGTMTSNTINGDRISAGTLDALKITASSITTAQIKAGGITADRLNVTTPSVFVLDGNFQSTVSLPSSTVWTTGGTGTWSTVADATWGKVAQFVSTSAGGTPQLYQDVTFPPGRHVVQAYVKVTAAMTGSEALYLGLVTISGTAAPIESPHVSTLAAAPNTLVAGEWKLLEAVVNVTASSLMRIYLTGDVPLTTGRTVQWANITVISAVTNTSITPGALDTFTITAPNIQTSNDPNSPRITLNNAGLSLTTGPNPADVQVGLYLDGSPAFFKGQITADGGITMPLTTSGLVDDGNKISFRNPLNVETASIGALLTSGSNAYTNSISGTSGARDFWHLDEASGSLADAIGTVALTVAGTAPTYAQTGLVLNETARTSLLFNGTTGRASGTQLIVLDRLDTGVGGTALNGRAAEQFGGTWVTSGMAVGGSNGDYTLSANAVVGAWWVGRTTLGDTSGRIGIVGSQVFAETEVEADFFAASASVNAGKKQEIGVIARYVDANNYIRVTLRELFGENWWTAVVTKVVAGVTTQVGTLPMTVQGGMSWLNVSVPLRVNVSTTGAVKVTIEAPTHSILEDFNGGTAPTLQTQTFAVAEAATAGALASGKVGVYDYNDNTSSSGPHYWKNFHAHVPSRNFEQRSFSVESWTSPVTPDATARVIWEITNSNNAVPGGPDLVGVRLTSDSTSYKIWGLNGATWTQLASAPTSPPANGVTEHLVVTWNASNQGVILYKNGGVVASVTLGATQWGWADLGRLWNGQSYNGFGSAAFTIGNNIGGTAGYNGRIDEVSYYTKVLSASAIVNHRNIGIAAGTPDSTIVATVQAPGGTLRTVNVLDKDGISDFATARHIWAISGVTAAFTNAGAWRTIDGGVGEFDPYSNGTALVYTVPRTGTYRVEAYVRQDNSAASVRFGIRILTNGVAGTEFFRGQHSTTAADYTSGSGFAYIAYTAGDTITFQTYHTDTGARTQTWRATVEWAG